MNIYGDLSEQLITFKPLRIIFQKNFLNINQT